jgi:hypothetical protein
MPESSGRSRVVLDRVRQRWAALVDQTRQSEINLAKSRALLKRVDEIIAQAEGES